MGKTFTRLTLAAALAGVCGSVSAQEVFRCDFEGGAFDQWTVQDKNGGSGDGVTWNDSVMYGTDNTVAYYKYSPDNDADDYLFSPAIQLEAGYYKLTFDYSGSSYGEQMDVFYSDRPDAGSMMTVIADLGTFAGDFTRSFLFRVDKPQAVHLVFHAKSEADKYCITVDNVVLSKAKGTDLSVTELVSPATSTELTGSESVKVRVTNNGFNAVKDFGMGYRVNGGAEVSETCAETLEPGATIEYTFSAKADLEKTGKYDFEVWTAAEGDDISNNDTLAVQVKHQGIATAPYFMGFEADEELDRIKVFNLNEDDGNWSVNFNSFWFYFSRTGEGCMMYDYDKANSGNDWFILEPISLEPGYYSLKFWYSSANNHNERLLVAYGTEQTPEAMTNEIVRYDPFNSDNYLESSNVIKIEKAGLYYFGFKAFSDKDENVICIDDISIEEISGSLCDVAVNGIENPANGYVSALTSRDIVYSVTNKGVSDVQGSKVTVSIDGSEIKSYTIDMTAQQTVNDTISGVLEKLAAGTHSLTVSVDNSADENADNNTLTVDFKVMGEYVRTWGAESGKIDGGLTVARVDNNVVNSGNSDLFPDNEAFSVIELGAEHPLYGNWQYCASSWFENGATGADRWLILPKVRVTGSDADLMWAAASYSEKFLESYEVCVSEATADPADFKAVMRVDNEQYASRINTRGMSLADYSGKDIYIAFRLVTSSGDMLVLDNIALYGDIDLATSGISESVIGSGGSGIVLRGNTLVAASAVEVSVYAVSGERVLTAGSGSVDVSSLAPGLYIVSAKAADGSVSTVKMTMK